MGYRSEVTMLFYASEPQHFPALKLWIDENLMPAIREYWEGNGGVNEFERGRIKGYAFEASDVKWYPDYPDVKAIEEAWKKFAELFNNEDSLQLGAERTQIGEDYSDVTYDCTFHQSNLLNVVRCAEY